MKLEGKAMMLRIYFGEDDKWHDKPLHRAIVEKCRELDIAGATVFHGTAGFGARSVLHTTHLLRLSEDLPVLIEIVETEDGVARLIPILDEMISEGLVTVETVRVIKYAPGKRPLDGKRA